MSDLSNEKKQIMIIAAEASSAHYAVNLIKLWKSQNKNYQIYGVGSDQMESLGFERFGHAEEMAVVGAAEIFSHYSKLKLIFNKLVDIATERRPDAVILMDYPEFNLMLAKKIHNLGVKVFYYISPQVWAWRKSRIKTIKRFCNKVFLIFPFEVDFYKQNQVPYEFVGHPLLEELNPDLLDSNKIRFEKERYGIKKDEKILALMPGSRKAELDQHFEIQLDVAKKILKKYPHIKLAILTAPSVKKENLIERIEKFDFRSPYLLLKEDPYKMISLADYVLVASGTATLMVGLLQKPMVIMYKMQWLTGIIAKMFVRGVKFFGLVNLILDKEVVPERMQSDVNPEEIFLLIEKYITDENYTNKTIEELKKIPQYLGDKGATARVAASLEKELG